MSDRVAVLFAISGEYEEYRARTMEVYQSVDAANRAADQRNTLVIGARERWSATWEMPEEKYEAAERKRTRILFKLRREASDPGIESTEIGDLKYIVEEARLVR